MNRREALSMLAGAAGATLLPLGSFASQAGSSFHLSAEDEAFLDDMQRRGCLFFAEQAGHATGQVLDRAAADNTTGQRDPRRMASIAATGFGLSALCLADKRGYMPHEQIVAQVRRTLDFHLKGLPHQHGFLHHFNDVDTGAVFGNSEVSSIDTSLFLCGVLTARAHFHEDAEIVRNATALYQRVDWPWMLNGGDSFSMGWKDGSFLPARWNHYCELMMIYLLAIGSPTHPVSPSTWNAWTRPVMTYDGIRYISSNDPLFVHQYSHAWYDFRGRRDQYTNYFENSILATRAHKAFCLDLGAPYNDDYWGISASDSKDGYQAWGGPPKLGTIDGSVVPCATAGSLAFCPADCLRVLRSLKQKYGAHAYGRYGFCDAFHPQAAWYDGDVLGIDLGIGVLMAENLRSGFVWDTFGRNPEVDTAFRRVGLRRS